MQPDDVLCQIESYAASFGGHVVRPPNLIEFLENFLCFLLSDPDAIIFKSKMELSKMRFKGDVDAGCIGVIVLDGIRREIHQQHLE